ncbi:hypothetical protein [Microbacterium arborescens]|uniref:hypothetical protein n=1 Tax=Microbacterium arborescens TaxID=33883 RepID=UPI00278561E1|nr:hypothetical protein [Microbacterium arborescens]MDQ1217463.1 hypothetical protein [Microbacterium arborescens]
MNDYTANVPHGVTAHRSAVAYQEAGSSRRSGFSIPGDLAGHDAIAHLVHEDGSLWRLSIHNRTVYAVLRRHAHDTRYTFDGPVREIAVLPEELSLGHHLAPAANALFTDLEDRYRNQPGSLHAAIPEIQRWAKRQHAVAPGASNAPTPTRTNQ